MAQVCIVSDPVMLHVWSCLHNYAYEDAIFAAERLFAETQSSESLHLLATSLYRIGRPKQASRLLTSFESLSPKCRYLLSKCKFDFGLLNEAEEALLGQTLSDKPLDELAQMYGEQACYAILLLGNIRKRQGKFNEATVCYKKCLELNPMLWSAFRNLCDIGEHCTPAIFKLHDGLCFPTPIYQPVECSNFIGNIQSRQDFPNPEQIDKPDLEELCRENVNPDKHNISSDSLMTRKTLPESFVNNFDKTYVSFSANYFRVEKTPEEHLCDPVIPKAPKPELPQIFSTKPINFEFLASNSSETPQFGSLARIAQSPMFACVPVFHKSLISVTTAESLFSGSSKLGNNTLPLRHSALNETIQNSTSIKSPIRECPSNLNSARRPSHSTDHHGIGSMHVAVVSNANKVHVHGRLSTEKTTTSTPACAAASLRRLVFCESPHSTSMFGQHSGNRPHVSPSKSRLDPPVLRSSIQRGNGISHTIALRSDVTMFDNVASNPTEHIALRATSQSSTNRMDADTSSMKDYQQSGPRTRSQTAAVAFNQTQGILRRSTRSSRSKTVQKKSESRQSIKDFSKSGEQSVQKDNDSHISEDSHSLNATFGEEPFFEDVISINPICSDKSDPRVTSLKGYLHLLAELGKIYQLMAQHNWKATTNLISKLPFSQLSTGRILSWAARAHIDNADYVNAKKIFSEIRRLEPWQLVGMDFYSTVLWQLQADHELSLLAHELLQLDRSAPEPWCAAGNCFSLQGEHEIATRFLQRAIQVCPTSAYAFTLLGHEQSTLEDFDKALNSFRHALRLDPRQYNALFGMSNVYYKQERFELADCHLSRAVALFPQSHLLLTNLGALRGRLGHLDDGPDSALALVTKACKIQPNNPLARYHRSSILFHLGRYAEVLTELQKLLVLTPREAMVYLMIGHTHKKLGNTPQAMIHYSWAMGLDPKGANTHLRDIMTNPPMTGRGTSRGAGTEPSGVENGTGVRRATRSRTATAVPSDVTSDDDRPMDESSVTEADFMDSDLAQTSEEPANDSLLPTTTNGHRIADFSTFLGDVRSADPLFTDSTSGELQETMDLGDDNVDDNHNE